MRTSAIGLWRWDPIAPVCTVSIPVRPHVLREHRKRLWPLVRGYSAWILRTCAASGAPSPPSSWEQVPQNAHSFQNCHNKALGKYNYRCPPLQACSVLQAKRPSFEAPSPAPVSTRGPTEISGPTVPGSIPITHYRI